MFNKGKLLLIDTVMIVVESFAQSIRWLKYYSYEIWKRNTIRKWAIQCISFIDSVVGRIETYLEDLRLVIQYRIHYEYITRPMKCYYKELRKKI